MAGKVVEKSMIPTVLVGVGGTGAEVLSRVRRFVEETYDSLDKFPLISFLWVDTDKGYKITNPEAAGSEFKDYEKCHATVSGIEVETRLDNMERFPWIEKWFPPELEKNISSLESGAGQIRACGRFAFFCNYAKIQRDFRQALNRVKGKENYMLNRYGIKIIPNSVNVFVTGSISGGTGSGMLIDLGYCLRHWLKGEGNVEITAIVPMPNAFAGISVGEGVIANGYAALMELSYFSDDRTEFVEKYSDSLMDEVRATEPPFNFTYLVGTKNGESEFKLAQIREAIAQNIFLDMTSDFAPHKRSIRDNIKRSWIQKDAKEGRGYSKQFMSFGLSTIEIPISQIRGSLANRLAKDLVNWWLNESVQLPPQMLELVRGDTLKRMRLTEKELIDDLSTAKDKKISALIFDWVNSIRGDITAENRLQCTQQGINALSSEKGKILEFVPYLEEKVPIFKAETLNELSPDERVHGEYLQNMYRNRDEIIKRGRKELEAELYRILEDRNRGVQFAQVFLTTIDQIFTSTAEKFRQEQERYTKVEANQNRQYEAAKRDINEFKDKFGVTKQAKMEQYCESALRGIESSANAVIRRKSRVLGLEVLARLQEHREMLVVRLNRFQQRTNQLRDYFNQKAQAETDRADALQINGIKLYDRTELNGLYQNLIEQLAGAYEGSQTRYEQGMNSICTIISEDILKQSSPMWRETRDADEKMRLFDLTEIPEVNLEDLQEIIYERTKSTLEKAPEDSRLKQELAACDRIFKAFNDETEITNRVRIAYQKSQPLMLLDRGMLDGAGIKIAKNANVALLGGINTSNPAAQKMLPLIQQFVPNPDEIKPLGEKERHRIVLVQEMGGFSLRCIEGMRELRKSYQQWLGESILAKRARLKGESSEPPIPVHLSKAIPFWDIFPEDPKVYKLVVQARALKILFPEVNRVTKELTICYHRQTSLDIESVDLASNWEEIPQVLEVRACREDREAIEGQVNAIYQAATTEPQKQQLSQQFQEYLQQRAEELEKLGGKKSPIYARDKAIILKIINQLKLPTSKIDLPTMEAELVTDLNPAEDSNQAQFVTPIAADTSSASSNNNDCWSRWEILKQDYKDGLITREELEIAKKQIFSS
ncbi:MAG TPA: tubulin-like doman-containing protein [Xenococcaceae cyanobacterium]|jgi:hypothetical protein